MAQKMQDEAGRIWLVDGIDAAGNPINARPAGLGNPSPMTFGTPDPRIQEDREYKRRDQQLQEEAAARAAAADKRAAEKDARTPSGKPMPDGAAKRYEDAINSFASLDRAIGGFKDDYAGNTITGGLENTAQRLIGTGTPGQADWWADFASTDNMIRNALFGASLTSGEKEAYGKTTVTPSMDPQQVKINLQRRRDIALGVLSRRTNFLKNNGYDPDAVDALAGEYGHELGGEKQPKPGAAEAERKDPLVAASGDSRTEHSDRMSAQIDSMVNAGASKDQIDAALSQEGFPALQADQWGAVQDWRAKNPGKAYQGGSANKQVPLTMLQQAAGSAWGSGLAHYADGMTAGTVGALAGEKGKGALDAMAALNPGSSLTGDLVGGVVGAMTGEGLAARVAPAALARFAPRISDALYGGLSGFNAAKDGEGGMGALTGAGAGLLGGIAGNWAAGGAGKLVKGVSDPAVKYLRARGVPLTIGQAVGNSGWPGAFVKGTEDAMTSIPGVSSMINARRMEGMEGFNRAAFQDAAAPGAQITATGAPGMGQVRQSVGDAYDSALGPVNIDANDPQFFDDIVAARQYVNGSIPNVNGAQDAANAGFNSRLGGAIDPATDQISGRGFQEAYRGMARTGRERANGDYGHEIGVAMRQGQDALGGALERQNPGAFDGFLEANAANRRANVLADALKNAANQGDELITPAQLNRADVTSTSRLEGKINSAAGNRPFYDLARAGQSVLPSKLPDSGTANRMMTGIALTGVAGAGGGAGYAVGGPEGAGTGTGAGLGAALLLALGGSKPAQRLAVKALLDRPDFARQIGAGIQGDYGRLLAGAIGAGTAPLAIGNR